MAADGITEDGSWPGARACSKGSFVLGLEDTGSRMSRLAKGELLYDDLMPVDELLARVDAVTVADVNALAAELLGRPMSLAVVGPFGEHDFAADPSPSRWSYGARCRAAWPSGGVRSGRGPGRPGRR